MAKATPHILVIFGASGDLTFRKLIPAVYDLYKGNFLPESFAVLGVSRTGFSDEAFRKKVVFNNELFEEALDKEAQKIKEFSEKLFYTSLNTKSPKEYISLRKRLEELDSSNNTESNYIYYLSTPPSLYKVIPEGLSQFGLNRQEKGFRRLIVEKPFGYSLETAKALNKQLLDYFEEEQIYRIDHYLGKESVQNLFVTRFANGVFEPLWNRNYISHIEISAAETLGVQDRGGYYDTSGALRDMVQNHLMQLVSFIAMEPPVVIEANAVRNEKVKLFNSIRRIKEGEVADYVIRGQYLASEIDGDNLKGYRDEKGVNPESKTETYVAIKFFIDNWRWAGVPFYVRTGKRLPARVTEVVIHFKKPPHHLFFNNQSLEGSNNQLVIRIQPDEGLSLQFGMKVPGAGYKISDVDMDFHYSELSNTYIPSAYERLLLDCMNGDATLYARRDGVEAAWDFVEPIFNAWDTNADIPLYGYPSGTWGPESADALIAEGRWRYPCRNLTNNDGYCSL